MPTSGKTNIANFQFSSAGSSDSDGTIAGFSWNFGDGSPVSTAANPTKVFTTAGVYPVTLTVTDDNGATDTETVTVTPKLDIRLATDHAVLGDTAPIYDVTQLVLDGSLRSSVDSDRVEVLTGSLRLATNPASYGFTASAGQCVAGTEVIDEPSDTYYTQWSVGSCQ